MKRLSPFGYEFIKTEESLILTVKGDTGGKQAIGYGHDLQPGETYPNGITEQYAEQLLTIDAAKCERAVNLTAPLYITQMQFDMLVDFTYECGISALHELLSHGFTHVPQQLPRWIHAHVDGKLVELDAMKRRRAREVANWNVNDTTETT